MTLFKNCLKTVFLITLLVSCEKEDNSLPVELINPTVSYERINNYYDIELNRHFTSYSFRCEIINRAKATIEKVVVNYEYSGGESGAFVYRNNLFSVTSNNISFKVPIRFNSSEGCTLSYRVITDNNEQSNMVFSNFNKPENAF